MKVYSFLSLGMDVHAIEVQVHLRFQIPSFQILGLAGPEIQEARERIIAAFSSSELDFPKKKIIVNLAPSDVKKSGTGHDLAMAIGIIDKMGDFSHLSKKNKIFAWGSLGLDGKVQPCGKMASLMSLLCKDDYEKILYLCCEDAQNFQELLAWRKEKKLSIPKNLQLRIIQFLKDVVENKNLELKFKLYNSEEKLPELLPLLPHQERVLDLSIVGRHHTLILGPKGVGKSQMLEWYRWLSPESDAEKTWQRLMYEDHSRSKNSLARVFPLRSVHAQVKPAHLLGSWGLRGFRAGELSLAHGGILVADEFLEWHRDAKECLREPLQNKKTTITRVQGTTEIDCDFQLIATGNLCPCGGLPPKFRTPKSSLTCQCHPSKVLEYLQRLSGPIADRIDLISILNQELKPSAMTLGRTMDSEKIMSKKNQLLERQKFAIQEFGAIPSELSVSWLETHLPNDPRFESMLQERTTSLRSRHKALRLARTIQAMNCSSTLNIEHLFEALNFRL
jgi:magnesium chelatase family protein